ncbi:MAG: ribosome biogenesis GTPase Der [Clostridia bacterium]|nr:ribosome biogenesis GTPase Der [Clostridia bacterium]
MAKPIVAIVGRPNVGKSTFFNKITQKKVSIVDDRPGVTRDRIFEDAEWLGKRFTLVDTGGIEPDSEEVIPKQMRMQAELAISSADVILFFTDAKEGVVPADFEVADMLRKVTKPVFIVVNKVDNMKMMDEIYDFYSLGVGDLFAISAEQSLGLGDLLDAVIDSFPEDADTEEEPCHMQIAIVGKPNAGKSSLTNRILGEERVIVSNIPGTTRDAIDTVFERNGLKYKLIDTAGIRRKSKIDDASLERYSVIRAFSAIRRADAVLIMIDATEGVSEQDAKIAGFVHEEGKPSVIAVNKWDLVEKDSYTNLDFEKKIRNTLSFMEYADIVFISAKTGQRVDKVLELVEYAFDNASRRISTGLLNDFLRETVYAVEPPSDNGRRLKIYYMTQVAVNPPTFVLFVNDDKLMHFSYERYLENSLRKAFNFEGTPIKIILRARGDSKSESGDIG